MFILNLLKDNYFSETQSINSNITEVDEFKNLTIKSITSLENISDLHTVNLDVAEDLNLEYSTSSTSSSVQSLPQERTWQDAETQTDDDANFSLLKQDNQVLKIKNVNLERNIKELTGLLADSMKLNPDTLDVERLRNQMTILLNRELRMNYPMPFSSILSKCSK